MKCQGTIRKGPRKGEPCRNDAVTGRDFCQMHGGNTLFGPAHPNFKTGQRSRKFSIPKRLAERYQDALADPELTHHRRTVAILESRADELMEAAESELLWSKAQAAFNSLSVAIRNQGDKEMRIALSELQNLLSRGHSDAMRWAEYYRVIEQADRSKERENKRLVAMEQMMSVEQLMEQLLTFVGLVVDVAKETIKDRSVLREFVERLNAVTPRPSIAGGDKSADTCH